MSTRCGVTARASRGGTPGRNGLIVTAGTGLSRSTAGTTWRIIAPSIIIGVISGAAICATDSMGDLPTDYVALDARRILGEEYEQLKRERDDLKQFKSHQQEVPQLCDCSSLTAWRDRTSAHLIYFSVLKPSPGCCGRRRNPV